MNIYLAGAMSGHKDFNFPVFIEWAELLRDHGHTVFSPAERDLAIFGAEVCKSETGDIKEAEEKGFSLREAMCDDVTYICIEADAIALIPGWEHSKGAKAEKALAEALGLQVIEL